MHMGMEHREQGEGCGSCNQCPLGEVPAGPWRGWRLVGLAIAFFLVPLFLGIVGALSFGTGQAARGLGACLGLVGGMALACGVGQWCLRASRQRSCP